LLQLLFGLDYKNARYVDFYKFQNASGPIGTVFFAHVNNPKADNTYNADSIRVGTASRLLPFMQRLLRFALAFCESWRNNRWGFLL
jgi:hypothetical protein